MSMGKTSSVGKQTRLRHLWLASLGAVVIAHREARGAVAGVAGEADRLRHRAAGAAGDAAARVGQGVAPLLERFGLASTKPVRKPSPRRATRKAAKKKPTPRPMSARKQAERRVASKGR